MNGFTHQNGEPGYHADQISIAEALTILPISRTSLLALVRSGELQAIRLKQNGPGPRTLYYRSDILALAAERAWKLVEGGYGLRRTPAELRKFQEQLKAIAFRQAPMSLRQLYYQAVVRHLVAKTDDGYNVVAHTSLAMRDAYIDGDNSAVHMPDDWIIDTSRNTHMRRSFNGPAEAIDYVQRIYRKDFWADRDEQICIWIEKEALAAQAYSVSSEYDVPVFVAKGFSSAGYLRPIVNQWKAHGGKVTIYYFRDLDPSGCAAPKALANRISRMMPDLEFEVIEVALTQDQIAEFGLEETSQETKTDDNSHWPAFAAEYGDDMLSYELDALPADVFRQLVLDSIVQNHVSEEEHEAELVAEEKDRAKLQRLMQQIEDDPDDDE